MITKAYRVKLANSLYGNVQDTSISPQTFYMGLATGNVSDLGVITGEIIGGGYSRALIQNNKVTFSTAVESNERVVNLIDIEFPESTASWGQITTIFLTNVQTGGTAIYYITVSPSKFVDSFTVVHFKGDPLGVNGDIVLEVKN